MTDITSDKWLETALLKWAARQRGIAPSSEQAFLAEATAKLVEILDGYGPIDEPEAIEESTKRPRRRRIGAIDYVARIRARRGRRPR